MLWESKAVYAAVAAAAAKSLQLCPTLCDPIDGSLPGHPVPGILQARTLEWVAISFSNAGKWKVKLKSLSHFWLCDLMDCSLPGSSVHGIFQARVLEWGAIAFSGGSVWMPSINGKRTGIDFNLLLVTDAYFLIKPTAGHHSQCELQHAKHVTKRRRKSLSP